MRDLCIKCIHTKHLIEKINYEYIKTKKFEQWLIQ